MLKLLNLPFNILRQQLVRLMTIREERPQTSCLIFQFGSLTVGDWSHVDHHLGPNWETLGQESVDHQAQGGSVVTSSPNLNKYLLTLITNYPSVT